MQDSQYRNPAVDHKVEHAVWKTAQQGASNAAVDLRVEEWVFRNAFERFFDTDQEVVAQTVTALLLKSVAAREIAFRLRADKQLAAHFKRR